MNDVQAAIREAINQRPSLPEPAQRRALREQAHLSQQFIADLIGVSRPMITFYEAGTRNPTGEIRRRYAAALEELAR